MARLTVALPEDMDEWIEEAVGGDASLPNSKSQIIRESIRMFRETHEDKTAETSD